MLAILLSVVFIIPVLYGWGLLAERILPEIKVSFISGTIFTGICFVTSLAVLSALFLPINIYTEALIIAAGFTGFFLDRSKISFQKFERQNLKIVFFGTLLISFLASFYPYILDHFGYYIPTVHWLNDFGFVKGLSNLDLTLGQASFWHIFQSTFSHISDPFLRINAVLLIIFLLYILEKKSWLFLMFLPLFLLFSQSPSPDLAVMILSLIVVNEILSESKNITFLFALSVLAVAVKPTVFWLPIFTFLYSAFIAKTSFKNLLPGFSVLILLIIKNLYLFGYPIFPVAFFDLNLPWKPDGKLLKISSEFAIQKTFDNQYSLGQIQNFTIWQSIKSWLFLPGIKSFFNIAFVLSLIAFSVYTFIKKSKIVSFLCICILLKSLVILIISAQYRFLLDVFLIIILIMLSGKVTKSFSVKFSALLSLAILFFFCFPKVISEVIPSYRMAGFMGKFEAKQFLKPSEYHLNSYHQFQVGNLKFNVSKNYPFNFDTPLPAISEGYLFDYQKTGVFPQMTDEKDISKGFISKKMTPEESRQLDSVIKKVKTTARR